MRYSAFLASALAGCAIAMPYLEERAIVTRLHTATAIETVVVFVTVTRTSSSGVQPTRIASQIGASVTSSTLSRATSSSSTSSSRPVSSSSVRVSSASSVTSVSPSRTSSQVVGPSHSSGPQQAFLSSGPEYQNAVLYHHNAARANHKAGPLVWNTTCEANARLAANMCNFAHYIPAGAGNGQNLFTVSGLNTAAGTPFNVTAGITESWYKGEFAAMSGSYGQASLSDEVFHQVGHLTQVLWQGTTSVGCVSIDCGTNMKVNGVTSSLNKFTVCNYAPAGNVVGKYNTNVLPPISTTNLGSWSD